MKKTMDEMKQKYTAGNITFDEYYLWLADFIGASKAQVPVSEKRINQSRDPWFNDIPLKLWDSQHFTLKTMAFRKKIPWSLSDTVCTLKALAKTMKKEG